MVDWNKRIPDMFVIMVTIKSRQHMVGVTWMIMVYYYIVYT